MCRRWSLRKWGSQSSSSNSVYGTALLSIEKDVVVAAAAAVEDAVALENVSSSRGDADPSRPLSLLLSAKFMSAAILLSTAAAFSLGCVARIVVLSEFDVLPSSSSSTSSAGIHPARDESFEPLSLPAPVVIPGKDVPYTTYTSKTFQVEGSATSHTLHIDRRNAAKVARRVDEDFVAPVNDLQCVLCAVDGGEQAVAQNASAAALVIEEEDDDFHVNDYSHNDDSDGLHLPAGQHLLVDIKDVDPAFLNSEERLATAMVRLIDESKLTLLSYHCHALVPMGVSCAGVLLESHVAFHTWPSEGVITMDLFTCGGNPLIPVLDSIRQLFAVPALGSVLEPTLLWSHKLRGFREGFAPGYVGARNPLDQDLGHYALGKLDFDVKEELVSEDTAFQTVDVYDLMNPAARSMDSYRRSLSGDGSYESTHPEQFGPDRVLFLDGVIQSTLYGDAPYHESIVHPAMVTHPNPERVAIIGGGEGATLREVLKHDTVEEAVMIEIDEGVVQLSKEHLPQWQDCSSISHNEKAAEWCFDDARVNARFEDAMAYFIDHFSNDAEQEEPLYDIIIMDALDPNDDIEFAVELYTNDVYIGSLHNALTANGILVVQVGEVPYEKSPADETGRFANRSVMKKELERAGFQSIHIYEEAHSGFMAPWSTLVAFKDVQTRERWYRSAAEIELQLQQRILRTESGNSSLRYFDGATMRSYQVPTKAFETIHCRQEGAPEDCNGPGAANTSDTAYSPVIDRHSRDVLHSREYARDNVNGWREVLLN